MLETQVPKEVYQICARHIKKPFRLFLFGSRATKKNNSTSDFDFYIETGDLSKKIFRLLQSEIEQLDTLYKIDLVNWSDAPEDLKKTIRSGKVIEVVE